MANKPIYVTQPSLAPLKKYVEILKDVWESGILTHNGPLVQKLEKEIASSIQLKQEVKARENILETAKKNTEEKQSTIIRLKRNLEKTKRDLVNTQIEMRKTQNLKSNLVLANARLQKFIS